MADIFPRHNSHVLKTVLFKLLREFKEVYIDHWVLINLQKSSPRPQLNNFNINVKKNIVKNFYTQGVNTINLIKINISPFISLFWFCLSCKDLTQVRLRHVLVIFSYYTLSNENMYIFIVVNSTHLISFASPLHRNINDLSVDKRSLDHQNMSWMWLC